MLLGLGAFSGGCRDKSSGSPSPPLCVPTVLAARRGAPELGRGLDQPAWHAAQATAPFVDRERDRPVPHTEVRASWDESALFLVLYVADDELEATDRVRVELDGARSVEASPDGALRCRFGARSDCVALGIEASFHVDGDVDATAREDEEWTVTLRLPWATLAPEKDRPRELPVSFGREDRVNGQPLHLVWTRSCGAIRME